MRDPKRIERICRKFEAIWKLHSDWRFGQIVSNLMGPGRQDVFFPEDSEWEELMDYQLEPEVDV